ncbi:MAG: YpoC family protein [Bacillus sp. (in: firmicutes)]
MDKTLEKSISILLKEWKDINGQLELLFRERDQHKTKELMGEGINLFIQFLSLSNGFPTSEDIPFSPDKFDSKPVNAEDRLGFIMSRPALYHSYRQLSELMVEQEKLYIKSNLLKKASKPTNG